MHVTMVTDRRAWEDFLARVRPPTFLQSWAWGETQAALGEEVIRLGVFAGEDLAGVAQAVTVTARRGKFLHLPHGPVLKISNTQILNPNAAFTTLLNGLLDEARRLGCAFLRVSPIQEDTAEHRAWYQALGFRPAPIHLHAERLWILDLRPSEADLLAGMRKTTRNLIRRAEREGVTVRFLDPTGDLTPFFRLYQETAARERFVPFSQFAIEAEIATFTVLRKTVNHGVLPAERGDHLLIGVAEHHGEPLAAAIVPMTSWSAFYHHGASSRRRPDVPAAYALQWALIREAKRRGCTEYNSWGIAPGGNKQEAGGRRDSPAHPWAGLTTFKTGFGGREVPLVPTEDLPLSWRYLPAYLVDTVRRVRRRFF